jgi:hypothetical protein
LFLASNYHSSATNPRGWFNDPSLDVTGADGPQRFRKALLDYTDRSIAILKRTGAQGAIVWDLEGEQFPHKTTYIGDPRLLGRLAPEMVPVVDDFFERLRNAGLRVGLTVRPQQLVFDNGQPRQTQVFDIKHILLEKIDYARARWGVSMFYVDSNGGIRRPDEVWQLRRLAEQRPDILLIPEHHYLPYSTFRQRSRDGRGNCSPDLFRHWILATLPVTRIRLPPPGKRATSCCFARGSGTRNASYWKVSRTSSSNHRHTIKKRIFQEPIYNVTLKWFDMI